MTILLNKVINGQHWRTRIYEILHQQVLDFSIAKSSIDCDVLLVCHHKDLNKVSFVVNSLQKFCQNPIRNIFVIGTLRNDPRLGNLDYTYIFEEDFLPGYVFDEIRKDCPKPGWIIQQLVKLSCETLSSRYIVIDCDTILLKPHLFFQDDMSVLRIAYESPTYYSMSDQLLGLDSWKRVSFVAHMMPIKASTLLLLKNHVESSSDGEFFRIIINIARHCKWQFSEYNLYARFLIKSNPHSYVIHPWLNKTVSSDLLSDKDQDQLSRMFPFRNSLSFHE